MSVHLISRVFALLAGVVFCISATSRSDGAITQQIFFEFDPTPGADGDEDTDSERISGNTEAEINRSINVSISASNPNEYSAIGSVGEFGTYGLEGRIGRTGTLQAQVFIEADVQAPPIGGVAREAVANFIVDGGGFTFDVGPGSTLEFALNLSTNKSIIPIFQSRFELVGSPGGGTPTMTTFGPDLGIIQNGTTFDIPFSFQSASLGLCYREKMSILNTSLIFSRKSLTSRK